MASRLWFDRNTNIGGHFSDWTYQENVQTQSEVTQHGGGRVVYKNDGHLSTNPSSWKRKWFFNQDRDVRNYFSSWCIHWIFQILFSYVNQSTTHNEKDFWVVIQITLGWWWQGRRGQQWWNSFRSRDRCLASCPQTI